MKLRYPAIGVPFVAFGITVLGHMPYGLTALFAVIGWAGLLVVYIATA